MPNIFFNITTVLFESSVIVALFAWLYSVFEIVATVLMIEFPYKNGRIIINFQEAFLWNIGRNRLNEIMETENGKFKFSQLNTCLFREKLRLFKIRLNTPFRLKGVMEIKDGTAHVVGRLPLGPSLFLLAWIVGWTSGGIGLGL